MGSKSVIVIPATDEAETPLLHGGDVIEKLVPRLDTHDLDQRAVGVRVEGLAAS